MRSMELPSQDNISPASTDIPPPLYLHHPSQHPYGMQRIVDPLARGRAFRAAEEVDFNVPPAPVTPCGASLCSFSSSQSALNRLPRRRKRQSVAVMSLKAAAALMKGRTLSESTTGRCRTRSFLPRGVFEDDTVDFPDDLDTSFFTGEGLQDELSSYADEVFETASEAARQTVDEGELTGSALDRNELERSHLMLPSERGWRKSKDGSPVQPKLRFNHDVVSRQRGQRIVVPVQKLFAREKRPYGLGLVGRLTNRTYRKRIDSYVKRQIEDMDDHRPFFSYWITFVHLLITILAVSIYGIAPIGFSQHETVDSVLRNQGVYENVKFVQQQNFWIGPSSLREAPAPPTTPKGTSGRKWMDGWMAFHISLILIRVTGGADPPGSQVFPVHASGSGNPQAGPGDKGQRERVWMLREERSLWLLTDLSRRVLDHLGIVGKVASAPQCHLFE
nr:inactive rhomboid protein 1-like isoform X3 [Nerophis lumbriciformis]